MTEDANISEGGSPEKGREGIDWFWLLAAPVTVHRDKMLVVELESQYEFMPVFISKDDAGEVLAKLQDQNYAIQAMHEQAIRRLAASKNLKIHPVNGEGRIVKIWEDSPGA